MQSSQPGTHKSHHASTLHLSSPHAGLLCNNTSTYFDLGTLLSSHDRLPRLTKHHCIGFRDRSHQSQVFWTTSEAPTPLQRRCLYPTTDVRCAQILRLVPTLCMYFSLSHQSLVMWPRRLFQKFLLERFTTHDKDRFRSLRVLVFSPLLGLMRLLFCPVAYVFCSIWRLSNHIVSHQAIHIQNFLNAISITGSR